MKRNFEDRLAELAFGELSLEESIELETQVSKDPKRAKELSEFRTLKEDLRSLADIPDHQLSNERLRDAILGQGLKPQPEQNSPWSWLWMPALSCCAAALLLMTYRSHQSAPTQVVDSTSISTGSVGPKIQINSNPSSSVAFRNEQTHEKSTVKHAASSTMLAQNDRHLQPDAIRWTPLMGRHHHHRVTRAFDPTWDVDNLRGLETGDPIVSTASLNKPANPQPSQEALKPIDSNDSDAEVVEIGTDKDQDTGAQKATEVGSAKNEVIGG